MPTASTKYVNLELQSQGRMFDVRAHYPFQNAHEYHLEFVLCSLYLYFISAFVSRNRSSLAHATEFSLGKHNKKITKTHRGGGSQHNLLPFFLPRERILFKTVCFAMCILLLQNAAEIRWFTMLQKLHGETATNNYALYNVHFVKLFLNAPLFSL